MVSLTYVAITVAALGREATRRDGGADAAGGAAGAARDALVAACGAAEADMATTAAADREELTGLMELDDSKGAGDDADGRARLVAALCFRLGQKEQLAATVAALEAPPMAQIASSCFARSFCGGHACICSGLTSRSFSHEAVVRAGAIRVASSSLLASSFGFWPITLGS